MNQHQPHFFVANERLFCKQSLPKKRATAQSCAESKRPHTTGVQEQEKKKPIQVNSLSTARREIAVVACIVTQSLVFSGPNSPRLRGIVSLMLPPCSLSPSGASGSAEGFGLMGVLEASRLRRDRRQALSCHDSYYAVLNCVSYQASEVFRDSCRLNWRICCLPLVYSRASNSPSICMFSLSTYIKESMVRR